MISVRREKPEDIRRIRAINESAFGQAAEANVIDKLRQRCSGLLSLVAVENSDIVGHILFSPVTIEGYEGSVKPMGLAPMAVVPERQREGIGSALVKQGLAYLRKQNCPFVIVLGHPEYYPRFGFELASRYGLRSQWEGVPDDAFMVILFDPDALNGIHGVARYRDEFNEAM